jgi:hypothetical protein
LLSLCTDLKKFGKHPVTGAQLKKEDLIPLTFHKNSDSELNLGYENTNAAHIDEDHANQLSLDRFLNSPSSLGVDQSISLRATVCSRWTHGVSDSVT